MLPRFFCSLPPSSSWLLRGSSSSSVSFPFPVVTSPFSSLSHSIRVSRSFRSLSTSPSSSSSRCIVFPGQGSQRIRMGYDLLTEFPYVKHIFNEADDAIKFHLTKLIMDGLQSDLQLTENAQPAILTHSFALWHILSHELDIRPSASTATTSSSSSSSPSSPFIPLSSFLSLTLGHSLGEYTSLCLSQSLSFSTAVRTVRARGLFMRDCLPSSQRSNTAMVALLPCSPEMAYWLCNKVIKEEGIEGVCEVANINSPTQVVISGTKSALERAIAIGKQEGYVEKKTGQLQKVKRSVYLDVSAPFHCSLMRGAQEKLEELLKKVEVRDGEVEVVMNVNGERMRKGEEIKKALVEQVTKTVQWDRSIQHCLDSGITSFIEMGAAPVLSPFIQATASASASSIPTQTQSICTARDLSNLIQQLSKQS